MDGPAATDRWEDASIPREGLEAPRVKLKDSDDGWAFERREDASMPRLGLLAPAEDCEANIPREG